MPNYVITPCSPHHQKLSSIRSNRILFNTFKSKPNIDNMVLNNDLCTCIRMVHFCQLKVTFSIATNLEENGSVSVTPRDAGIMEVGREELGAGWTALPLCWGALVAGEREDNSCRPAHHTKHWYTRGAHMSNTLLCRWEYKEEENCFPNFSILQQFKKEFIGGKNLYYTLRCTVKVFKIV